MKALAIYAGRKALEHLKRNGLGSADVRTVAGAAGGPKALILGPLDRFLFGHWLPQSAQSVDLVGGSIGACRLAAACLRDPLQAFHRFERGYVAQDYPVLPGERRPPAQRVSALFQKTLRGFYGDALSEVLHHPRYRLHVITSRGKGLLSQLQTRPAWLGFLQAYARNLRSRQALAASLERVVFSSPLGSAPAPLPFDSADFPTTQVQLSPENCLAALQASCSIPFVLEPVHAIAGAPAGWYWDGGLVDYHLHLNYQQLVLYPHFQAEVVPGWFDKHLKRRHRATAFLDWMILLAPQRQWVSELPNGKLPDRTDFTHYARDVPARQAAWRGAVSASEALADEWAQWLERPDLSQVSALT